MWTVGFFSSQTRIIKNNLCDAIVILKMRKTVDDINNGNRAETVIIVLAVMLGHIGFFIDYQ